MGPDILGRRRPGAIDRVVNEVYNCRQQLDVLNEHRHEETLVGGGVDLEWVVSGGGWIDCDVSHCSPREGRLPLIEPDIWIYATTFPASPLGEPARWTLIKVGAPARAAGIWEIAWILYVRSRIPPHLAPCSRLSGMVCRSLVVH